jgi:hypothetical protein
MSVVTGETEINTKAFEEFLLIVRHWGEVMALRPEEKEQLREMGAEVLNDQQEDEFMAETNKVREFLLAGTIKEQTLRIAALLAFLPVLMVSRPDCLIEMVNSAKQAFRGPYQEMLGQARVLEVRNGKQ